MGLSAITQRSLSALTTTAASEKCLRLANALRQLIAAVKHEPGLSTPNSQPSTSTELLAASYYERWLTALATLVVEKQVVSAADLDQEVGGTFALSGPVRAAPLGAAGPDLTEPRFSVGDAVRVRVAHPRGHTRCPGYVRGRRGVVVR